MYTNEFQMSGSDSFYVDGRVVREFKNNSHVFLGYKASPVS